MAYIPLGEITLKTNFTAKDITIINYNATLAEIKEYILRLDNNTDNFIAEADANNKIGLYEYEDMAEANSGGHNIGDYVSLWGEPIVLDYTSIVKLAQKHSTAPQGWEQIFLETSWASIQNTPITLLGYGITDAYSMPDIDAIRTGSVLTNPTFEGPIGSGLDTDYNDWFISTTLTEVEKFSKVIQVSSKLSNRNAIQLMYGIKKDFSGAIIEGIQQGSKLYYRFKFKSLYGTTNVPVSRGSYASLTFTLTAEYLGEPQRIVDQAYVSIYEGGSGTPIIQPGTWTELSGILEMNTLATAYYQDYESLSIIISYGGGTASWQAGDSFELDMPYGFQLYLLQHSGYESETVETLDNFFTNLSGEPIGVTDYYTQKQVTNILSTYYTKEETNTLVATHLGTDPPAIFIEGTVYYDTDE